MRAAVLTEYKEPLEIKQLEQPDPDPHGAVVEVEACGICRSDWHAWQGHGEWANDQVSRGQILGHEPAGVIVKTGENVTKISQGDKVTIPFNLGDGACKYCQTGHGNVCSDGFALGFELAAPGAFAEYVHIPHADYNLAELPEQLSPKIAATLGCRFITAYHGLVHRADFTPGDWVAVFGCGGIGLSLIEIGDALGAKIIAVDIQAKKLQKANEVGADETLNASQTDDIPTQISQLTNGGVHIGIDALGSQETAHNSIQSLRTRGTHLQLGLTSEAEHGQISIPSDIMTQNELSFVGSRGMPPTEYDELFRLIESGQVRPDNLLTAEVALSDVSSRLQAMTDYQTTGIEVVTDFQN